MSGDRRSPAAKENIKGETFIEKREENHERSVMATANAQSTTTSAIEMTPDTTTEEMAAKAVYKRYEGLMMVRTKAIKGKGAWYWNHLQPILVVTSDSGAPKAVKLRCSLCDAVFSASNPSRTASEHLKRGTCPNFSTSAAGRGGGGGGGDSHLIPHHQPQPQPISSLAPTPSSRKRSCNPCQIEVPYPSPSTPPLLTFPSPQQPNLVLSGGKDDLGALAMLEDSVKKLKSPNASPNHALSKSQIDSSFSFLSDWFYECAGLLTFSSVEHPKFCAFLRQVGLPQITRRELAGARLDTRYEETCSDADARIREALFFQLAAGGWKPRPHLDGSDSLVSLTVNLPNGTVVFRRALIVNNRIPFNYAEDVLWDTVSDVSARCATRCAGIVSDRFKSTALRSLENQNHWMVNLSCQLQGFRSLIQDLAGGLPLFHNVTSKCSKIATFFNNNNLARTIFHKYQIQELDRACLLCCSKGIDGNLMVEVLEDIIASTRPLQLAVHDDSYKNLCAHNPEANHLAEVICDMKFWNDLEAAHSIVKLIADKIQEMETDRPLVGQCLPLWEELRAKIRAWCSKYNADEAAVQKLFDERFKKNYHPAWSAAFILDPLYLTKDTSGKYLPPYKCLTPEQDKDVDKLITRLASREEAHIVLNELMKWRSEGMDPIYAQAVQVKQLDPATGKMKIANPQSSRLVWETCLSEEFGSLAKVAVRLIFLNATAGGFKCNPALATWLRQQGRSRAGMERAQKMIFVAAQSRLERRDFSGDEEKDVRLFADGYVDELNAFMDPSSV